MKQLGCFLASSYTDQTQQTGAEEPDGWGDWDDANIGHPSFSSPISMDSIADDN